MLLALAISLRWEPALNTVMAISIVYLPIFSRTARFGFAIREMEYIEAARLFGAKYADYFSAYFTECVSSFDCSGQPGIILAI